jgi:hypothetical protein
MLHQLRNLFKQKEKNEPVAAPAPTEKIATEAIYDFKEINYADLPLYPDAIAEMYTGRRDGFLIKNVLTSAQVDTILKAFDTVQQQDKDIAHTPVGFTHPPIFAEYSRKMNGLDEAVKKKETEAYFELCQSFNTQFNANFGIDAFAKITAIFTTLSGGRKVTVPDGVENKGNYPFATFRYLIPEQGLMSVHCGNYFGTIFDKTYDHLTSVVAVENQMSFFIMLNEPDEGGELSLFNFRWEKGQTKTYPGEDNEIIMADGSKRYLQTDSTIQKNKIRPRKGDMILFQGGNIWHRVEMVKGTKPRITLGGFLSLNYAGDKILYWS